MTYILSFTYLNFKLVVIILTLVLTFFAVFGNYDQAVFNDDFSQNRSFQYSDWFFVDLNLTEFGLLKY